MRPGDRVKVINKTPTRHGDLVEVFFKWMNDEHTEGHNVARVRLDDGRVIRVDTKWVFLHTDLTRPSSSVKLDDHATQGQRGTAKRGEPRRLPSRPDHKARRRKRDVQGRPGRAR